MGWQYSSEDLLKIRQSPLVCKPSGMPPTEEWMGPPQEQHSQNRRHNDNRHKSEGSFGIEGHSRPSLLETRHTSRGSSNLPADIVLGPPKTAFASAASLKSPRALDSPGRSAFGNFGSDTPRTDYFNRSKQNTDKEGQKDFSKQGREGDTWGSRKHYDEQRGYTHHGSGEEMDSRGPRRNQRQGDWNQEGRRNGRDHVPSWSKDEETFGVTKPSKEETDANIENIRSRAWRDNERDRSKTHERDWDRNHHTERDPEWMIADEPENKKEKHTAQDIEAWKAQMKAQSKGAGSQVTKESSHIRNDSGSLNTKSKLDTPLTFDKGMDSFFNLWDKPQSTPTEQIQPSEEALKAQQAKAQAKASRFTGFFAPSLPNTPVTVSQSKIPPAIANPEMSIPAAEDSAMHTYNILFDENAKENDDKAGFDRMLSMLRSSAPVAEVGVPQLPLNPLQAPSNQLNTETPHSPTIQSPRFQKKHGLETILGQPRQPETPRGVINKDTEFLLNLLRKDEGLQQHFPGLNQQKFSNQPSVPQRSPEDHFIDERRHAERYSLDKLNPTAGNQRIPQARPFEHPQDTNINNPPFHELGPRIPHPPGFDQHPPPPGFDSTNLMAARGPLPPPGFPNRGTNQGAFPPGLLHNMGNLNLGGHDRGPPFMGQVPHGFAPGPPHHFPPHGFPGGPGLFPGTNGPLPSMNAGRPPPLDAFGPPLGSENGNHNAGNMNGSQHMPGPPPGFQRQD